MENKQFAHEDKGYHEEPKSGHSKVSEHSLNPSQWEVSYLLVESKHEEHHRIAHIPDTYQAVS